MLQTVGRVVIPEAVDRATIYSHTGGPQCLPGVGNPTYILSTRPHPSRLCPPEGGTFGHWFKGYWGQWRCRIEREVRKSLSTSRFKKETIISLFGGSGSRLDWLKHKPQREDRKRGPLELTLRSLNATVHSDFSGNSKMCQWKTQTHMGLPKEKLQLWLLKSKSKGELGTWTTSKKHTSV